jgi:hypothetical protein
MKLDMFLVIGLMVNVLFAVTYPTQIFGENPLGLDQTQDDRVRDYYSVNGTSILGEYNTQTGQLESDNSLFTDFDDVVSSTDGSSGFWGTELFQFVDWLKIGWNLLKATFMFVIGFVFMLWTLVYPFNFLIGVPFSVLYLFTMVRFIVNR